MHTGNAIERRLMHIKIHKYRLDFKFEAGTSRGVMTSKDSWIIKIFDAGDHNVFGIGECSPLPGLSPDLNGNMSKTLDVCQHELSTIDSSDLKHIMEIVPKDYPALRFAYETALLDLKEGGRRILYDNAFTNSKLEIPINGLVWMGDKQTMLERIKAKITEGYTCIKIKIGAINFQDELELLKYIRSQFPADQITIRLDANGAFNTHEALIKLDQLAEYGIHSLEQPIAAGNWLAMEKICNLSPIPIALDEELIGVHDPTYKMQLLERVQPTYIILKPTLVGGLKESKEWIDLATERNIGWWITSALESNIGLNAIAQFTANYSLEIPQGLGTGQLFHNNFPSPLKIRKGNLSYDNHVSWNLSKLI